MTLNRFSQIARSKWTRYSLHEQATILYCLILLCLFVIAPLVSISQIASLGSDSFGIYNALMAKTAIVVTACLFFLIAWNSSFRWKHQLYRWLGLGASQTMVTAVVLFMILMQLFAMSDTIVLLKENVSSRFSTTGRFLVIGIYLIGGIIRQLVVTRIQRKNDHASQELLLNNEIDDSRHERGFEQMEKEFQGLFGEEGE